jgi:hypothetical protein
MSRTEFLLASFSKDTPNKVSNSLNLSGKNTVFKPSQSSFGDWRVAIAEKPVDAKADGKKIFCVRVDNSGECSDIQVGFTPQATFDSNEESYFGGIGFDGGTLQLFNGNFFYPECQRFNIIDSEVSKNAKEIITILEVSDDGKKKEIRFLCDGNETRPFDVSEIFKGDFVYPAICMYSKDQQVTTIPIDEIKERTLEIENLIKEYQQQQKNKDNNQSGVGAATSPSSVQLQKELDEALQKIAALSSQLQQEKQKSSDLEKEVEKLKQQLGA